MRRRSVLALLALPACLKQAYLTAPVGADGAVDVPAASLGQLTSPADVLLVRAEGAAGSIAVRRRGAGYLALVAVCSHRGCELSAGPQSYDCACHGSRFDLDGQVLEGPAEQPLRALPMQVGPAGARIAVR